MNLCLGTVQFGLDYGIRGRKKPSVEDSVRMIDYAVQNGIDHIDTAAAYGTAEDVLGAFLARKTVARDTLFVSAKLRPNILDGIRPERYYEVIGANIRETLRRLGTDYVDAYMCHSSRYVHNAAAMEAMARLKDEGLARRTGVSVYEVDEAMACLASEWTDFMQLPFSVLDQRMSAGGVFDSKVGREVEIHSRSAFIQGLTLMSADETPEFLARARPMLDALDDISRRHGISRLALSLGFVKTQPRISHLVFGVHDMSQLKEDIETFRVCSLSEEVISDIAGAFQGVPADIVMPSLWKKD